MSDICAVKPITRTKRKCFNLMDYARKNRKEGFVNDVIVKVDQLSIPANRMVLACHSRYFENIFKANTQKRIIEIEGGEKYTAAVNDIIDYFYTGSVKITRENVTDLLTASDHIQVNDVKEFCYEYLESIISPDNAILILHATKIYQNDKFTNWIYQFISNNLSEVALTRGFKSLSKPELTACLTQENKSIPSESSKCEALISWVDHDKDDRGKEFPRLFQQHVHLDKLSTTFIKEVLLNEKLIRDDPVCFEQVLVTFSELLEKEYFALSQSSQSATSLHQKWSGLYPESPKSAECFLSKQSKVISIGGYATRRRVFDVCNFHDQELRNYCDLPEDIHSHCALKLNHFLFYIGGETGVAFVSQILKNVWRINLKQENAEWIEMTSMNKRRCSMGAAIYEDKLVVAGGKEKWKEINSVEYYDPSIDEWKIIAPLKHLRKDNALVACEGCLYALGGTGDKSVERLRDLSGEWEDVQPMQKARLSLAAVCCDDMIYAIGGQTGWHHYRNAAAVERWFHKAAG